MNDEVIDPDQWRAELDERNEQALDLLNHPDRELKRDNKMVQKLFIATQALDRIAKLNLNLAPVIAQDALARLKAL